jgi:hypothetical protein
VKRLTLLLLGLVLGINCLAGGVVSGPWVTETRENSITVLWTTDVPGQAYVELADGRKIWETFAGRHIFQRLHTVHLEGLQPGEVVTYRVCGVDLVDDRNARDPKFGATWEGEWHSVRTFDRKAPECRFSVINDIHMKTAKYRSLAAQVDSSATNFIFLNGDIVSAGNYVVDSLARYMIDPLGGLPAGIPVLFARGNHEGRGNGTRAVAEVFPNSDPAPFYYTFRSGPAAFIVFDGGETHVKRSRAYCGDDYFVEYMEEQLAWARKAMKSKEFRSAPVKICLVHVPMIDHEDKTDFLLQRWMNQHFMSLLNKAGIDLMIGADLHEFMWCEPGTMGNKFPIIVNDDVRRMDVVCTRKGISLKTFNAAGEEEFSKEL